MAAELSSVGNSDPLSVSPVAPSSSRDPPISGLTELLQLRRRSADLSACGWAPVMAAEWRQCTAALVDRICVTALPVQPLDRPAVSQNTRPRL